MNNILEKVNRVYAMFGDNLSKKVFETRVEYNFYGDAKVFVDCLKESSQKFYETTDGNIESSRFEENELVVIYGAGIRGKKDYKEMVMRNPTCRFIFCDSNYEKLKNRADLMEELISPDELISKYKNHKVVISIAEESGRLEVFDFLKRNGVTQIWSTRIYDGPQYFEDFLKLGKREIFVDAGVLNGATSLGFANYCDNEYEKIYLFEADSDFEQVIRKNISSLADTQLCMKGLWSKEDTLPFVSNGGGSGHFVESGIQKIEVTSLDEVLQGDKITFLKMDIEGAEMEALVGAKNTIQKYKPKLAICVYHKSMDILDIPLYINSLVPEYKFYLRHYSSINTETVLYAVLPEEN